jgi:putative ABC transport system ATP-binding protein
VKQLLRVEKLYKVFNRNSINEAIVFDNFTLKVKKSDFITIVGSNGAGKSSLLNIIAGSLETDGGSISINENEISKLPEYKRSKYIGRVFQDPSKGAASDMTILENMSMAYNKGKSFNLSLGISTKNIKLFKEMLSELELGLEDKLYTKVGLLSGGQRQALCLIMAVMKKPELLLLDEHTAALDPKTSERIIEITERIVKENNTTTLMVTHNLNHAVRLGNRLIMLHRGKIIADISGEEKKKLTSKKLIEMFNNDEQDLLSDRMLLAQ